MHTLDAGVKNSLMNKCKVNRQMLRKLVYRIVHNVHMSYIYIPETEFSLENQALEGVK